MENNTWENYLGTDGFAFIEFAAKDKAIFDCHFSKLGFTLTGVASNHDVLLYEQGDIKFFVNNGSDSKARDFAMKHGDSASAMGFYVFDADFAFKEAIRRGAMKFDTPSDSVWYGNPAIEGIGGSAIYFVDRNDHFLDKFKICARANNQNGLNCIDHLTHNVYRGSMDKWADFYSKIFGFRQIRYFDIDGKLTGLFSKAMTSACGKIKIPLNESKDDKSQIQEFLRSFNGEGIQHIALTSNDIYRTVQVTRKHGMKFMDTPDTYYELINKRLPNHGEEIEKLYQDKILIDGVTVPSRKILLQIFTQNLFGPVFFEIIQRKGDDGFGEGNFQALFDSIELDQMRRGVV